VDAVYLVCIEINEHVLRKAYRLSYRFDHVKIIASTQCPEIIKEFSNIEIIYVSDSVKLKFEDLECTRFSYKFDYVGRGDLAEKRTFAIQDAVDHQFESVLMLDDDIWPVPETHRRAFIDSGCEYAGQPPLKQPDLSAIERVDSSNKTFHNNINGNYLYLKINKTLPFFPRIYNEDWFFLNFVGEIEKSIIFDNDYCIHQSRKNIINSDRAYFEEFGEFVIDLVLTANQTNSNVSRELANKIYTNRRKYLIELGKAAREFDAAQSVDSALRALDAFDPSAALDYIEIIRAEMGRWQYV
jgi:hypothetical protein